MQGGSNGSRGLSPPDPLTLTTAPTGFCLKYHLGCNKITIVVAVYAIRLRPRRRSIVYNSSNNVLSCGRPLVLWYRLYSPTQSRGPAGRPGPAGHTDQELACVPEIFTTRTGNAFSVLGSDILVLKLISVSINQSINRRNFYSAPYKSWTAALDNVNI